MHLPGFSTRAAAIGGQRWHHRPIAVRRSRRSAAPVALGGELLEPRSMLSATAGVDRPALEPSVQPAATVSPWGPHPAYVVTHVSNGTITKTDPVSGQPVDLMATPTTAHPSALLAHLGNRLVQPNEPLQWSPADATQPVQVTGLAVHGPADGVSSVLQPKVVSLPPPPANVEGSSWPAPLFRYGVTLDGGPPMSVQQVTGMDADPQATGSPASSSPPSHTIKMPGIAAYGSIAMGRVIAETTPELWQWLEEIAMNTAPKTTITVSLLNQAGSSVVTWTLQNAWPTKVLGTALEDGGNQVKIDEILIAYETLIVTEHGSPVGG